MEEFEEFMKKLKASQEQMERRFSKMKVTSEKEDSKARMVGRRESESMRRKSSIFGGNKQEKKENISTL